MNYLARFYWSDGLVDYQYYSTLEDLPENTECLNVLGERVVLKRLTVYTTPDWRAPVKKWTKLYMKVFCYE